VDLPLDVIVRSLEGFCVCYFKDKRHDLNAPPHYYITVPITDDSSLLLCIITSQIEKRMLYYRKGNLSAIDSLVCVDQNSLSFLKKESIIDCNKAELIQKHELSKIIDPKYRFEIKTRDIPAQLKQEIVLAIKKSPLIKTFIKKLVIPY